MIKLKTALAGVPAKNILNFDETNLFDETDNDKWVFRKRVDPDNKDSDNITTHTGIMFAGTASGQLLTPYILYKSTAGTDMVQGDSSTDRPLYFR